MKAETLARYAWPGALALVAGIYAYWASHRELVSSRPSSAGQYDVADPVPIPGHRAIHARLWEDPISTAYQHWKGLPESERVSYLNTVQDVDVLPPARPRSALYVLPILARRVREHLRALRPEPADEMRVRMRKHREPLPDSKGSETHTLCLPVLAPGGPYAEDKERRKRIRYAVVTALAESGYSLQYSSQLTYLVAKIYVRVSKGWQQREIVVPVKRYGLENDEDHKVLVLWVAESELGNRPLVGLDNLLHGIFPESPESGSFDVAIIGPASSDALAAVKNDVDEIQLGPDRPPKWALDTYPRVKPRGGFSLIQHPHNKNENGQANGPIRIFSPRATTGDIRFKDDASALFTLHRVVGTDDRLAHELVAELKLRGALDGTVVLINEHDTRYGRRFRKAFDEQLDRDCRAKNGAAQPTRLTFRVLRGIDGSVPESESRADRQPRVSKPTVSQATSLPAEVTERRPEGRSQYDYLRRLPQQIRHRAKNRPITAIGVVGTDIYDKLLVLRALRPHFPDSVFFTTDMDAIYTHPNETGHTHNLIVASHFGLTLNPVLQEHTAPFRDSYQTSTFLATRLAIHKNAGRFQPELPEGKEAWLAEAAALAMEEWFNKQDPLKPLCYLVGRKLPIVLDRAKTGQLAANCPTLEDRIHPQLTSSDGGNLTFLLTAILVAGGTAAIWSFVRSASRLLRRSGRTRRFRFWAIIVGVTILVGAVLVPIYWLGRALLSGLESPSLFNGDTTWPRNLVYVIVGFCAALLLGQLCFNFRMGLEDAGLGRNRAAREARRQSHGLHELNVLVLGTVVLTASYLLLYGPPPPAIAAVLVVAAIAIALLTAVLARLRQPRMQLLRILRPSTLSVTGCVLWAAAAVTVLLVGAVLAHYWWGWPAGGWHPVPTSRGPAMRTFDRVAAFYALGSLGLLLTALFYVHYWCRVYARGAQQNPIRRSRHVANEYYRLRVLAGLTEAPTRWLHWVMGLLLILVLAYHPAISPTPMPLGVLVLTSLGLAVFVTSTILLAQRVRREYSGSLSSIEARIAQFRQRHIRRMRNNRAASQDPPNVRRIELQKKQIEELSDGVFRRWQDPIGWILGGGTVLALLEFWVRGLGLPY